MAYRTDNTRAFMANNLTLSWSHGGHIPGEGGHPSITSRAGAGLRVLELELETLVLDLERVGARGERGDLLLQRRGSRSEVTRSEGQSEEQRQHARAATHHASSENPTARRGRHSIFLPAATAPPTSRSLGRCTSMPTSRARRFNETFFGDQTKDLFLSSESESVSHAGGGARACDEISEQNSQPPFRGCFWFPLDRAIRCNRCQSTRLVELDF